MVLFSCRLKSCAGLEAARIPAQERKAPWNASVIDVVSDVVCPWCYLGKARLELAIAEVQDEVGVDINWRPYRLNPDYPKEGVDQKKALAEKLGGEERVAQGHKMLTDLGREVGIAFDFEASRSARTRSMRIG
jgi:predicted DsbA family dithiol-disulfide isomerase